MCVVVALIEGFHLTAACRGMLAGRNKKLDKLCLYAHLRLPRVRVCVCESCSSQTSRRFVVFVLFCLFYKWWSSRRERARHSALPQGKRARRWASSPQHHPPPPTITPHDKQMRTACACMWWKWTITCEMSQHLEAVLSLLLRCIKKVLVVSQSKRWYSF